MRTSLMGLIGTTAGVLVTVVAVSLPLPAAAQDTDRPDEPPGYDGRQQPFSPAGVKPRYLVTYMHSVISERRSATAVSVTNLTRGTCHVSVKWFRGFATNDEPSCITNFALDPDITVDFCSRDLPPFDITSCNSTCDPELDFHEGRAIVCSSCEAIGVSGRVYYTGPEGDSDVEAITDSRIVPLDTGKKRFTP